MATLAGKNPIEKQKKWFKVCFNKMKDSGISIDEMRSRLKSEFCWGCSEEVTYWSNRINNLIFEKDGEEDESRTEGEVQEV
jgi:hypothetical protein